MVTSVYDNGSNFFVAKRDHFRPLYPQKLHSFLMSILSLDFAMVCWKQKLPSVQGVPPPPTCLLSQIEIPSTFDCGIAGSPDCDQLLKDRQPWETYWRSSHKHVMMPFAKVEEAALGDLPRLWSCFCRASKS
jgi:hypothetical protein